jgi:signal transduction histidine kinase
MSSVGTPNAGAVADVLHDLGQPLAAIRALATPPITRATAAGQDREALDRLRRIAELADWMSDLLGRGSMLVADEPGRADAAEVIADVVDAAAASFQGEIRYRRSAPAPVPVDPVELRRAFGNVVDNAIRAAGPHGLVEVRLRRARGRLLVEVRDDGPGFGKLEPRSGRGLAVTQAVLGRCGGILRIAGGRSGGSVVRLEIPLARGHVPAAGRRA